MANVETREPPPPDTRFHASRGILLTQIARLVVRIATAAGLARLVSPRDYGLYAMAALLHGLAYMVQDFGLAAVTLRKPILESDERTALFWLNAGIGATLMLVVAALGPVAAAFYHEPLLTRLLPVMAVSFLINGLNTQLRAQLGREHRFGELNRIEIVGFAVSSVAALVAAWWGAGYWALALLLVTTELTIAIGVWLTQRWRPGRWPAGFSPRAALAFGAGISGNEVLRYAQRNADQFFLGRWFGPGPLGLYGRGVQLVTLPGQYFSDPLNAWVIASLGRAHDAPLAARDFWIRVVNGLAHLTLPLAVILFCLPAEVLRFAFGPDWSAGAGMLRALSIALVAQPVMTSTVWLLIATGHGRRLVTWSALTLAATIGGCVFARSHGPAAIAGAVSGVTLLSAIGASLFALTDTPVRARDVFAAVIRPSLLGVLAAIATTNLLTLLPLAGASRRLLLGLAVTGICWGAGCVSGRVREELANHFLRRR